MKRLLTTIAIIAAFMAPLGAQNRTQFGGRFNAVTFAYGVIGNTAPSALQVATGVTTTGSGTLTLVNACTVLGDGTTLCPITTTTPITVGSGSSADTVTPTAVSQCQVNFGYQTCQVTASWNHTHGTGDLIMSGTAGLQESLNYAAAKGGGAVDLDYAWTTIAGGTTAMITAAIPYANVFIEDLRGVNSSGSLYYSEQPTTLTSLAVPATLTGTTVVFAAAPVGTWANSSYFFCVTYVDPLGGEGPCSATYNQTPTLNFSATVTSPPASTGAVGWRLYAGASYAAAYLMPITSTVCTLTTAEQVIPACAIGSNGVFLAPPLTTTTLRPNAQTSPSVNVSQVYPQGHTTFAYTPSGSLPEPFQSNYGPFVAFGSTTSAQVDILGSVNLPVGYLNVIGRVIRISGKIAATVNTAAVPTITVSLGWVGGLTAGAPIPVCTDTGAAYGSSAAYNLTFSCVMTTNAIGITAIGSIMTNSVLNYAPAAGGAGASTIDTGTAAIATLGLFAQNTVNVSYTSGTNTTSAVQLLDLHVETLQ